MCREHWAHHGQAGASAFQPTAAARVKGLGVCKLPSGPQQDSAALFDHGDPPWVSEALGSPTQGSRFHARGVATAGDVIPVSWHSPGSLSPPCHGMQCPPDTGGQGSGRAESWHLPQ